jgi:hypothetical protein
MTASGDNPRKPAIEAGLGEAREVKAGVPLVGHLAF